MVIADSAIWIDYLKSRAAPATDILNDLLEAGQAVLVGIVVAEIFRGARTADQAIAMGELLAGVPYLETTRGTWERAGHIAQALDTVGQPIPLPDVIIGAMALENEHHVLTRDRHFERIPGLRLYQPQDQPHA